MTPRSQLAFVNAAAAPEEIRRTFLSSRRTRVPVFRGNRDNVIGFLHVEDMLHSDHERRADDMLHAPVSVAPTRQVDEMLDFFEQHEARAALVVDEFGSVDGIVTLADVTNFLFAGVFEGAAAREVDILAVEDGFEMDGATTISTIRKATGLALQDPLMTTIAGTALRHFGQVPEVGDEVEFDGLLLTVLAMDGLRISRLRLQRVALEQSDN